MFDSNRKPNVSKEEFKKVRSLLAAKGFTEVERNKVEAHFWGDLEEGSERERGIDAEEIERRVKWLRERPSKHNFSESKIDILEEVLKRFL